MDATVFSAAVMTHPARRRASEQMKRRYPELSLQIASDPDPAGPPSSLRTARRAWQTVTDDATHHLVVQDDAVLCTGFTTSLRRAVAARPDHAVCLFAEWGSRTAQVCRLAALHGAVWGEVVDEYIPSQALVLPADLARGFDTFAAEAEQEGQRIDDTVMLRYLRAVGTSAYVLVPNLADHTPVPSLADNDIMGERRSVCFADSSPVTAVTGLGTAMTGLPVVPHFSWWEGRSVCCLRTRDADGWRKISTGEFLVGRGVSRQDLRERFERTIADVDAESRIRSRVSNILLFEIWLTAFALGMVAATRWPGSGPAFDIDAALARPAAQKALATMPAGGLRRFVPEATLPVTSAALEPLVRNAIRQGAIS